VFLTLLFQKSDDATARNYKDSMIETELEKEKEEIMRKLVEKKKEEERELLKRRQAKDKTPPRPKGPVWKLEVRKDGKKIDEILLDPSKTYRCGRDEVGSFVVAFFSSRVLIWRFFFSSFFSSHQISPCCIRVAQKTMQSSGLKMTDGTLKIWEAPMEHS
jgi:hypothetical protein